MSSLSGSRTLSTSQNTGGTSFRSISDVGNASFTAYSRQGSFAQWGQGGSMSRQGSLSGQSSSDAPRDDGRWGGRRHSCSHTAWLVRG